MRYFIALAALLAFCCTPVTLYADEPCSTCSDEPQFPEAAQFLEQHGYAAHQYSVLLSWSERVPGHEARFVTGYHIKPLTGEGTFDLYSDGEGNLLSEADIARLGIKKKSWDQKPVQTVEKTVEATLKVAPATPKPVSVTRSISPRGGQVLPEIDWAVVEREDRERSELSKGAKRIGVFVELPEPVWVDGTRVTAGEWVHTPEGWLWSYALMSPDAVGIRVHLSEILLPDGAQVVVYNADDSSEAYGPFTGPAQGETDLWTPTIFGDTVVVECIVPTGVDRDELHLGIDRVTHQYIPLSELPMIKGAGSCELDVTCYNSWQSTSRGVAGIGTIGSVGTLWCTGSLLNDSDADTEIPYFLTANHCVGSQSSASNIEVYWLYQTPTCNGVPPDPRSVPRTTGGAQMLATSNATSGTDFALLRLNNTPAVGVTYLGWTSDAAPVGTAMVCIHHPAGDYKRISFGDITNVNDDLLEERPRARYHQAYWRPNLGVTEPGSSGSPLFIGSSKLIIGQLWGGWSSCSPQSLPIDYYGRFDVSFPLMEQYLDPNTTIEGEVEVTMPRSGQIWQIGDKKRIRWSWTGNIGDKVKIDLYRNGSFLQTLYPSTRNDGKKGWIIPDSIETGGGYFVRVTSLADTGILDNSDTFSLRN